MSEGLNFGGNSEWPDEENPENWFSLDYVHEQVLAQLQAQSDLWDAVDGRLRLILGFIGIVFAAAIGLQRAVPVATGPSGPVLLPFWVGAAAAVAVMVYLIAGLIVAVAYWPTPFDRPPKPDALREQYLLADPRQTKLDVIDTIIEAYNRNTAPLARKNLAFKVAFVLTGIATALMGVALIGQIALVTSPWGS